MPAAFGSGAGPPMVAADERLPRPMRLAKYLAHAGVARVYTPKDFRLVDIVRDLAELAIAHRRETFGAGRQENRPNSSIPPGSRPMERT